MSDPTLQAILTRFAAAECSWLSTVRPDGRAHATPIWHVWQAGRAYLVTTERAVKTANIAANPSVVLTHPDPLQVIIIEGTAGLSRDFPGGLRERFQEKYSWDIGADPDYTVLIEITPTKLMAWGDEGAGRRTRWSGADVMAVSLP